MENEQETQDSLNPEGEAEPQTAEPAPELEEFYKAQELAKNYKIRAEKAETELKALKQKPQEQSETPKTDELSQTDLYFLIKADVPMEDFQEVRDYAKLKNLPIQDALKTNVIKTLLSEKAEERKSAAAANTGTSKRGSHRVSDEVLIERAMKGELPESDEDMDRLARARLELKRRHNKQGT